MLKIVGDLAGNSRRTKSSGDIMSAGLRPSFGFPDDDLAVIEVTNLSRFRAIDADEAEAAQNLFPANPFLKPLDVSESVLEREHDGARMEERREKPEQLVVCCCLQTNQN